MALQELVKPSANHPPPRHLFIRHRKIAKPSRSIVNRGVSFFGYPQSGECAFDVPLKTTKKGGRLIENATHLPMTCGLIGVQK